MDISSNKAVSALHLKLNDGIDTLVTVKNHLDSFQKDTEATVMIQLKNAKAALRQQEKEVKNIMASMENLVEARKEETIEAVAEWKTKHTQKKLEKRAVRAEAYSEACVKLALYYAAEAELAILEAITARQDAIAASNENRSC